MARRERRKRANETEKKECDSCKKEKPLGRFYKTSNPMFPDNRLNICNDCLRDDIDVENKDEVIGFLRQIDKPFIKSVWDASVESENYTLGEYLRKINSISKYRDMTYFDSDGINDNGSISINTGKEIDADINKIKNINGEIIEYSDELLEKWGTGYEKHEYLKLEKFYQDMRLTHEIYTAVHVQKLMELSHLQISLARLRQSNDIPNYTKLATTIDKMEQSAGFRPADRQGIDEATGIKSFSQIWEQVEKQGFRKPPKLEFDEDEIDSIIVVLANYYHRLIGKEILTDIPEEIKQEMDEFFAENLEPDDIDDDWDDEKEFNSGESGDSND